MSTIKTTGTGDALRVIIKAYIDQVRVSCSCCPDTPDCCILPADEDWELLEENSFVPHFSEWPEQLRVNWTGRFVGIIDKSATFFEYQTGNIRIRRNDEVGQSRAWILEDLTDPENIVTRTIGRCLIRGDGGLTQGDNLVEDLWADQYITNSVGSRYPPYDTYTVTFTRVSLCEWVATSGHPPECAPWTLSYVGTLTFTAKGGGFQIVLAEEDPQTEFCDINAEENGFFYPDGDAYNSNENYNITLTPL